MIDNPCVRCGKPRICEKTWTEVVVTSTVTYSNWVCPDDECQKVVAAGIKIKKEKAEALRRDIEEKALARKANFNKK